MMSFLFSLVWGSWIGRITTAVLLGLVALKTNNIYQRYEGKQEIVKQSEEQGTKNNAKADAARKQLDNDKYFNQRLQRYCRDCKG